MKTIDTIYVGGGEEHGFFFEVSRGLVLVYKSHMDYPTRDAAHIAASDWCRENGYEVVGRPAAPRKTTEAELADQLAILIGGGDSDDLLWRVVDVESFANAGVMTQNAGVVVRLGDGTRFNITITRSR